MFVQYIVEYENIQDLLHITGFSLAKGIVAIRMLCTSFKFSPRPRSKLTPSDEGGDGLLHHIVNYGPKVWKLM